MRESFKISLYDKNILYNNVVFRDYLKANFLDLYKMEKNLYNMPNGKERFEYRMKVIEVYERLQLPFYIIVYLDDSTCFEALTGQILDYKYLIDLKLKKISDDESSLLVTDYNYSKKILNFFNPNLVDVNERVPIVSFRKAKKKILMKKYGVE